ncbi:hypothetical protein K523DRAFT_320570 [Schizophyllum commune Tattone D]|nr:hypothetical protein K523DRAFT_320570 [Schizophyllum commune Tattone D]
MLCLRRKRVVPGGYKGYNAMAEWTRCKPVWSGKKGRRSISANLKRSPQRSRRLAASRALMPVVPMVPSSMWRVSGLDEGPHCHNIFPDRISVKRFAARYGTAIRAAEGEVCSSPNAGPSWRRAPLLSDPSSPTAGPAALDSLRRQYTRAPKHPSPLNPARDSAPSEYVPSQPARPPSGAISLPLVRTRRSCRRKVAAMPFAHYVEHGCPRHCAQCAQDRLNKRLLLHRAIHPPPPPAPSADAMLVDAPLLPAASLPPLAEIALAPLQYPPGAPMLKDLNDFDDREDPMEGIGDDQTFNFGALFA